MCLYKSTYEMQVPFHDLDPMNVVWHGNYIKYLEQARCDMLSKLNYGYFDMLKDNYAYPVAKMNTKFIKPAQFGDVLLIDTELTEIEPSIMIKYIIYNKSTSEKIFEGMTMQIGVNVKTRESVYTAPSKLKEILGVSL